MRARRVTHLCLGVAMALAVPASARAHPLHTTLTELSEDRARGIVRATIRVFADDFGTAVAQFGRGRATAAAGLAWDAAAIAYVSSGFTFSDQAGRLLPLRSCGMRRTEGLLWICVEATSPGGLGALRVRNGVLSELFDDQVNVVQGTVGGARRSLLFTRGDRAKPIV